MKGPLRPMARVSLHYTLVAIMALEAYAFAFDLLSGSISDPWIAFFPVLWMDMALITLLLLAWGISFSGEGEDGARGWRSWLVPDFGALRRTLRSPTFRAWALGIGLGYALVLMVLQRIIILDLTGEVLPHDATYPIMDLSNGPVGWGPKVVWAPDPYFAILLRPYTVAVTALLSILVGLGAGLAVYRWRAYRRHGLHLGRSAGATVGLLVMCPACSVTPGFALFAGLLAPVAGGGAATPGLVNGRLVTFSTAMLTLSTVILWIGLARASRAGGGTEDPVPVGGAPARGWRRDLGRLFLLLALVLAVEVLLADLAGAAPAAPSGHGEHGGGGPAHAPIAIGLAILGPLLMLSGLALLLPGPSKSARGIALMSGLTFLYGDGVVHWLAVLEHIGEPAYATFFVATGAIQVLTVPFLLRRPKALWWIGVALTIFLVDLYALSVTAPAPLALGPESLSLLGNISKGLELALLVSLAAFFGPGFVPMVLRDAVARGRPFALLLAGATASDLTITLEASWGLLPTTSFLLAALLLAALVGSATLAHLRPTGVLVGTAWSTAMLLVLGHVVYAMYFARISLMPSVALCLASAAILGAPVLLSIVEVRRTSRPGQPLGEHPVLGHRS